MDNQELPKKRLRKKIIEKIFKEIAQGPITPNALRNKVGLSLPGLNDYLNLIEYIQRQPPIMIETLGKNRLISFSDENPRPHSVNDTKLSNPPSTDHNSKTEQTPPKKGIDQKATAANLKQYIAKHSTPLVDQLKAIDIALTKEKAISCLGQLFAYWNQGAAPLEDDYPAPSTKKFASWTGHPKAMDDESAHPALEEILMEVWGEYLDQIVYQT